MPQIDPCSPLGRTLDIMRQGFMKPLPKMRPKKEPPPIVSCYGCMNWHRKGKHILPLEQRRANQAKFKCK